MEVKLRINSRLIHNNRTQQIEILTDWGPYKLAALLTISAHKQTVLK